MVTHNNFPLPPLYFPIWRGLVEHRAAHVFLHLGLGTHYWDQKVSEQKNNKLVLIVPYLVIISVEERHKRERESLVKEMESHKAEAKKAREDARTKAADFDKERKKLLNDIAETRFVIPLELFNLNTLQDQTSFFN